MVDYLQYKSLFDAFGIEDHSLIQKAWQEEHRVYHDERHLAFLLDKISRLDVNEHDREILTMVAFMHDIVYDPMGMDNEEQSVQRFLQLTQPHPDTDLITKIIIDTKFGNISQPSNALSRVFVALDTWVISHGDFDTLWLYEKKVAKEYQKADYALYKNARIQALLELQKIFPQNANNLDALIQYLKCFRPKVGVYPGSFNPFHIGHLNILLKAEKIFDKVIIASGVNPEKDNIAKGAQSLGELLYYRQVEHFDGLLTDYITSKEADVDVTLIRGLRNGDDLAYEMNQLNFMRDMKPDLKMIFLHCDREFEHISSSALRNLQKIGKGYADKYLP